MGSRFDTQFHAGVQACDFRRYDFNPANISDLT